MELSCPLLQATSDIMLINGKVDLWVLWPVTRSDLLRTGPWSSKGSSIGPTGTGSLVQVQYQPEEQSSTRLTGMYWARSIVDSLRLARLEIPLA